MARRRPEVVFHLAAQADVRVSVADPVFDADVNMIGTLRVLEGARRAEAGRVVFAASGGTLYGEPDASELPLKESLPHRPLSPYGVSKKAAIDYLVAYREMHSLEFSALALANVYGPRQDPHGEAGVVAIFAERLLRGEQVTIFGDGEQTRDFVYVDDVVDAFVRAATKGGGLLCNIGTGRETSVNELYREMAGQAGVEPNAEHRPLRQGEVLRNTVDPSRAAIQLGWVPWTELGPGTAAVLEFVRSAHGRRRRTLTLGGRGTDGRTGSPGTQASEPVRREGPRGTNLVMSWCAELAAGHPPEAHPGALPCRTKAPHAPLAALLRLPRRAL